MSGGTDPGGRTHPGFWARRREARLARRRRAEMVRAWRGAEARRQRLGRAAAVSVFVVAVMAGAAGLWALGYGPRWSPGVPAAASPDARPDAPPVRESGPATAPAVPPADPFEGSPAERYADGAQGLVFPRPRPVAGLTAQEVGLTFLRVRQLLTAAYLDPRTLENGRTGAFAKLLDDEQRARLGRRGLGRELRGWVTVFAPRSTELARDVIKVNGRTTIKAGTSNRIRGAVVRSDYVFVYAIRRPGAPHTLMRLVGRHHGEVFVYRDGLGVRTWLLRWNASHAPIDCDFRDGYVRPVYPDQAVKIPPSGRPIDPYDLSERDDAYVCRPVTRT